MKIREKSPEKVWSDFQELEGLSDEQLAKFRKYEAFLSQKNEEFNLTALTQLSAIVRQHFSDSMALRGALDLSKVKTIADIGTGGGFPAIPLKIMFPHLKVILIEVTKKKQRFLAEVANILELDDVEICGYDWRTFLRITEYDVDLFVTRAALGEKELCRMFKPGCRYKDAKLVYWASDEWECDPKAENFIVETKEYKIARKKRKFVFFGLK